MLLLLITDFIRTKPPGRGTSAALLASPVAAEPRSYPVGRLSPDIERLLALLETKTAWLIFARELEQGDVIAVMDVGPKSPLVVAHLTTIKTHFSRRLSSI